MTDWYKERHKLKADMMFQLGDNSIVKLDKEVPGDGTRWYVANWSHGSWGYYDDEVEPGDLVKLIPEPEPYD